MNVAALYIQHGGVYWDLPGVDAWDEERDARNYRGPWPVVAHPPCGTYSLVAHLYQRDDADCAIRAVAQVREFGGVLEHPAHSKLWRVADLALPVLGGLPDAWGGYTIEVCQVEWGHVARKRTWLYCVGVPRLELKPPFPGREPTHWCSGFRTARHSAPAHYKRTGCAVPPGIKVCSAQQRNRTPIEFRDLLLDLARSARR